MTIYSLVYIQYSFPNLESVRCSMSGSNCCFLTCIQVSQEASKVVWYSHLLKNFPQFFVSHTVKGFSVVNEAKADIFLEFFCFFYGPADVGNLISGSSAFSKSSLNIWKFLVHILLKPSLKNFERCLARMCNECNCGVVWIFFGIALLWDWNENWPFPVLWPPLSIANCWRTEYANCWHLLMAKEYLPHRQAGSLVLCFHLWREGIEQLSV